MGKAQREVVANALRAKHQAMASKAPGYVRAALGGNSEELFAELVGDGDPDAVRFAMQFGRPFKPTKPTIQTPSPTRQASARTWAEVEKRRGPGGDLSLVESDDVDALAAEDDRMLGVKDVNGGRHRFRTSTFARLTRNGGFFDNVRSVLVMPASEVVERIDDYTTQYLPGLRDAIRAEAPQLLAQGSEPRLGGAQSTTAKESVGRGIAKDGTGLAPDKAAKLARKPRKKPRLMVAYHGSPYDFDEFSVQKIGTGEGAAVYGRGLYFSENKSVAETYRDKLAKRTTIPGAPSGGSRWVVEGVGFPEGRSGHAALDMAGDIDFYLYSRKSGNDEMAAHLKDKIDQRIEYQDKFTHQGSSGEDYIAVRDFWKNHARDVTPDRINERPAGRLYEVDLKPADDEWLDWDKPLSQQSEKVKKALRSLNIEPDGTERQWDGSHAYKSLAKAGDFAMQASRMDDAKAASQALRAAGVKGIRYLDQGSRAKGEGTYNYVVFDDRDIKITAKLAVARRSTKGVFFSGLRALIESKMPARAAPGQVRALIAGAKKEEVEWTGLSEWLDEQKGPVTKEDVKRFLDENEVAVNEVELSDNPTHVVDEAAIARFRDVFSKLDAEAENAELRARGASGPVSVFAHDDARAARAAADMARRNLAEAEYGELKKSTDTKYGTQPNLLTP
jgi:hypothetical protein